VIYVDLDKKLAFVFDQVEVIDLKNKNCKTKITVKNLTSHDASVKILTESKDQSKNIFIGTLI
jgi:hypothetical protein